MKIILTITHDDNGGAQNALVKYGNVLKALGHEVDIICFYSKKCDSEKIRPLTNCKIPIVKYLLAIMHFLAILLKSQPNAIISFLPLSNVMSGFFGRLAGIDSILISHRNPVQTYNPILRILDKIFGALGFYDVVICNSNSVLESVRSYPESYKSKTTILHNFVERDINPPIERSLKVSNEIVFLAVGRLSTQKRFDVIIEAMNIIASDKYRLLIAGDGELRTYLEKKVNKGVKVDFLGNLDSSKLHELYRDAHIYLQPSAFEGQSNSLLEAINFAMPVISSKIPAQCDVLLVNKKQPGGVLVDSFEPSDWANEMMNMANDKDKIIKYSEAALQCSTFFSMDSFSRKIREILK